MKALGATEVPVPRIFGTCADPEVLGSDFFVMEMVDGRIFWDASFAEIPMEERAAHFDAMNSVIAAMHNLDPVAVGLGDYGKAGTTSSGRSGAGPGNTSKTNWPGAILTWMPSLHGCPWQSRRARRHGSSMAIFAVTT